jgi:aspartyl-tRNA(Asn)/glutamyl-tRNA(Gln) amidotransferase subunit A
MISPLELYAQVEDQYQKLEPKLNSFITFDSRSEIEASSAERNLLNGEPGLLLGIPISVKDLILTSGLGTTCGSRVENSFKKIDRDAPVIRKLRREGAIIIGKTNLHEFAFGITSENEHFGAVRNPWNLDHVAGGSSGGSAASLAVGLGFGSIGTDTRGSIRIPAACCGISGLKPTRGLVSTRGVFPLSHTLDHVGPMARYVSDLSIMMAVLTGNATDYLSEIPEESLNFRVGLCPYYFENIHSEVIQALEPALEVIREKAYETVELNLDILPEALRASDVISLTEAVFHHDYDLQNQPQNYGPRVKERLEGGYSISGPEYLRALKIRAETIKAFQRAFRSVDCLVAPAIPIPAPKLNTPIIEWPGEQVESIVQCMVRLNAPQNVAGIPCLTVPCGFSSSGLPIGIQFIGWKNRESLLLAIGRSFQAKTDWHLKRPDICN